MIKEASKIIGLLRKLLNLFPRISLTTVYKSLIRPCLDYSDIIYGKAYDASFHEKLGSIKYTAALAITGAIRKIFEKQKRWYRKFCYFQSYMLLWY